MRDRLPLPIALVLIAVAVLIGLLAVGSGIRHRNGNNNVITVTGSAKQLITSDYAIWDFSITSQNAQPGRAESLLDGWTSKTQAFLKKNGIEDSELTVYPISTSTVTASGDTNDVIGYQLTRNFEVRSARVDVVQSVAKASSRLLTGGIPFSAQPLQYVFTKLDTVRGPLLAAAVRDAQERGKTLLAATGAKLGKLRGVDVSPFQITPPNSTEVSDYGEYDTSTLKKQVEAVVNVTFGLG